jgi:glycoprotein 6-alpha-L-fucosyltransferase
MQTYHGDASQWFKSLDDVFYFGGQNAHNLRAVEDHDGGKSELSFRVGDLLGIAGNHWDGFSKGTHRQSAKSGLYPSYKVVNDIVSVPMPVYPHVKEEEEEEGRTEDRKGVEEREERVGVAVDYGHR